MPRKQLVIVGGGIYGVGAVSAFLRNFNSSSISITLIEKRDDFIYLPINCRNLVEDMSSLIMPYDDLFKSYPAIGKVKKGLVIGFDRNAKIVNLESGESLKYDILVRIIS
ncbi:uncharacterized protein V2V93DRAFT_362249 [Kockiozyma suomiensis]|uniref:uncharacterized protein n=1 Tax=Kockiozyma suomiensis TaxID=1337062 RepID=UPI00334406EC